MTAPNNGAKYEELFGTKFSRFRRILPQFLATTAKNLLSIDCGLAAAMPVIIIAAMSRNRNDQNRDEFLSISGSEASWIGSIAYITQMIGSLASGFLTDPLGRKRAMILVSVPYAIGWLALCQTTQVWHIFFAFGMLGLAIGLMEASIVVYIGEICEPSTRGVLLSYSSLTGPLGGMIVYVLNAWLPWRSVALVCLAAPVMSAIALCFIPETPYWLLSKHRTKQAQKSLSWLRGWVPAIAIENEFNELKRHSERSNACYKCNKQDAKCSHTSPTLTEKLAELKQKQNLKPLSIVLALFFLVQFTGVHSMKPYLVGILKAYESPISTNQISIFLGICQNLALITLMCLIRFVGKRRFFLIMSFGIFISSLVVSCYGFIYLPSGFHSFDSDNNTFQLANPNLAYIPTVFIYIWFFCTYCGFAHIPWMLLGETFSLRTRTLVTGISATLMNIMGFISKKTYYNFETTLSMAGVSLLYCIITGIGLIVTYFIFPETEGKTLEDIEQHFADDSKKLTDHKIRKSQRNWAEALANQQLLSELKDVQIVAER